MLTPPLPESPPPLGPLASADEDALVAAYPELCDEALTLSWAATLLGLQAFQLVELARAGELLAIPGPWKMRQAHASDLGYFLPAWQLAPGARTLQPGLSELVAAAAAQGWTSLRLHRFMTSAPAPELETPAELLHTDGAAEAAALIRGETRPRSRPEPRPQRSRRSLRRRGRRAASTPV